MTKNSATALSKIIKKQRLKLGLGSRQLARLAHIDIATVVKYESGERSTNPNPIILGKLAKALELPLADLYAAAGYTHTSELPSMPVYLRAKYSKLPEEAHKELDSHLKDLQKRYGKDMKGPAPGEDE
jgi:transcriptional regulator with XRE-family HTH domain